METKVIQGAMDNLQESFPEASPYTMKKTCNKWEKMTQVMITLKQCRQRKTKRKRKLHENNQNDKLI